MLPRMVTPDLRVAAATPRWSRPTPHCGGRPLSHNAGSVRHSWDQLDRQSVELIELTLQVGEMLRFSLLPRPALRLRLSLLDELKSVFVVGDFD
jgi:hypothetical protein